ncbi:MAG: SH3 domain-containing protein [Pseudomonadota bacterium]
MQRDIVLLVLFGVFAISTSSAWGQARRAVLAEDTGAFMSIAPDQVNMRAAPRAGSLIQWVYVRAGLPVLVIETYDNWRKVVDPDGTRGWMRADMLSKQRTAMVMGGTHALFAAPRPDARQTHLIAAGNVGLLSGCITSWCKMRFDGAEGWILRSHIWGVFPTEEFP